MERDATLTVNVLPLLSLQKLISFEFFFSVLISHTLNINSYTPHEAKALWGPQYFLRA